jgi:hypothetical protein
MFVVTGGCPPILNHYRNPRSERQNKLTIFRMRRNWRALLRGTASRLSTGRSIHPCPHDEVGYPRTAERVSVTHISFSWCVSFADDGDVKFSAVVERLCFDAHRAYPELRYLCDLVRRLAAKQSPPIERGDCPFNTAYQGMTPFSSYQT